MNTDTDFQRIQKDTIVHDDDYFSSTSDDESGEETFEQFETRTRAEMDYYLEHEDEILRERHSAERKNHINKVIRWQGPSATTILVDKMNSFFKAQKENALKKLETPPPPVHDGKLVWNNVKACEPIQEVEEDEPAYKNVKYPSNGGRLLFRKQPTQGPVGQQQRLLFRKPQEEATQPRLLQRKQPSPASLASPNQSQSPKSVSNHLSNIDKRQSSPRCSDDKHPAFDQQRFERPKSFAPSRMCHFQNRCKRTNCEFAHSIDELTPVECRHVMCHYFSTCRFYHKRRETKQQYVERVSKL